MASTATTLSKAAIGDDDVLGGSGNDYLHGDNGSDELRGGTGDDLLDGGLGADTMNGGTGDDTYIVDYIVDTSRNWAGNGADTVLCVGYVHALGKCREPDLDWRRGERCYRQRSSPMNSPATPPTIASTATAASMT